MILFLKDWQRYPTAIIDINTSNKSFLRLATLYRSFGVKNHAFLLALVNPELQGVDPFDPGLTDVQKAAIALEAMVNPWYYFRMIARAPAIGGGDSVPMEANRGNISLFWLFFNHVMTFLIQIRQTGKSFSTDTLMTYLMHIACKDTEINLLTKDDALRRTNVTRLKDIAAELPSYLNQRTKDDVNNTEEITVNRLKNRYKTHVPQASEKRALNLGRGMTSGIFHIDEAPFQPNIAIALPAALAATGAAVDRAKAAGSHYGTILTTTAGKKDDKDGAFVYQMLQESAIWSEKFLDCENRAALYKTIRANSPKGKLRVNITMNHRQLGKSDAWLMSKLEESVQTGDAANRDYFNMWTSGSQTSPLPTSVLQAIRESVKGSEYDEISEINGYILRWYIPQDQISSRMAEGRFVIGCDTSNANGVGDDIAVYIMDVETMETVATATINETNLIYFAKWLSRLLIRWPNTTLIIENRSSGQTIIDYILIELTEAGIDPFKRMYNTVVNDKQVNPTQFEHMVKAVQRRDFDEYMRLKRCFGFATSGGGTTARSSLYSAVLQLGAKRSGNRIYDKILADQITGLITKNGRVDHPPGEHDDMVISWLLTHWLITQAKNLKHYGIDPSRVGRALRIHADLPPEVAREMEEQRELREKIKALAEKISQSRDVYLSARIEQEMRRLSHQVILEENEMFNIDEVIRTAREKKRTDRAAGVTGAGGTIRRTGSGSWSGYSHKSIFN